MKGTFTADEARHLTVAEHDHYFSLGLCPPPLPDQVIDFGNQLVNRRIEELEEELSLMTDIKESLESRLDYLNGLLIGYRNENEALKAFKSG